MGGRTAVIRPCRSSFTRRNARRGIRKHVQLTMSGCIGPCPMLNVVQVVFDGRPVWFQSINTKDQVIEIYDYIDGMLAADAYLPPPPQLSSFVFNYYRWNHTNEMSGLPAALASMRVNDSEGGHPLPDTRRYRSPVPRSSRS